MVQRFSLGDLPDEPEAGDLIVLRGLLHALESLNTRFLKRSQEEIWKLGAAKVSMLRRDAMRISRTVHKAAQSEQKY